MAPRSKHGFSLLSLLVTLAIAVVLASMLFGAISRTRAKSLEVKCMNNLRQIGVAFRLYLTDHDGRYPPNRHNKAFQTENNPGGVHWQDSLKVYLTPYPDSGNITATMAGPFWCPADIARKDKLAYHSYGVNNNIGGAEKPEESNIRREPNPSKKLHLIEMTRSSLSTSNFNHNTWPFTGGSWDAPDTDTHVDFRHGKKANGLFLDGRVAPLELRHLHGKNPITQPISEN